MARGTALTETEKWAITAMVEAGLSVTKIANKTARSETVVRKYIDENLKEVRETISRDEGYVSREVEKYVYEQLLTKGLTEQDAMSSIKIAKGKLTETIQMERADLLVASCLRLVNPKKLFTNQSMGGRKGVTVMQAGASELLDHLRKNRKPSKNVDDHIYKQEHSVRREVDDE